jgi:sulfur relay (sulfurtransferase) complex TusBCD TusD component (DsrE family)
MEKSKETATGLIRCLNCDKPGVGLKNIICQSCVDELFKNHNTIVFCKKCKRTRGMDKDEIKQAEIAAGIKLASIPDKKIILVLESCSVCYKEGDSRSARFAALNPVPEA